MTLIETYKSTITPPVKYFAEGTCILDAAGNHIVDIRGWSRLQKLPNGEMVQDAFGEEVAKAINYLLYPTSD